MKPLVGRSNHEGVLGEKRVGLLPSWEGLGVGLPTTVYPEIHFANQFNQVGLRTSDFDLVSEFVIRHSDLSHRPVANHITARESAPMT